MRCYIINLGKMRVGDSLERLGGQIINRELREVELAGEKICGHQIIVGPIQFDEPVPPVELKVSLSALAYVANRCHYIAQVYLMISVDEPYLGPWQDHPPYDEHRKAIEADMARRASGQGELFGTLPNNPAAVPEGDPQGCVSTKSERNYGGTFPSGMSHAAPTPEGRKIAHPSVQAGPRTTGGSSYDAG